MFAARVLSLTDDGDRSAQAAIVRAFTVFLLCHLVVRTLQWTMRADDWIPARVTMTAALAVCALVGWWWPARTRVAAAVALGLLAIKLIASFPTTSNHFFMEFLCLALVVLCDADVGDERALLLSGARWLTVVVLFYSGVQKVLHGTYFDAQFLGLSIGHKPGRRGCSVSSCRRRRWPGCARCIRWRRATARTRSAPARVTDRQRRLRLRNGDAGAAHLAADPALRRRRSADRASPASRSARASCSSACSSST